MNFHYFLHLNTILAIGYSYMMGFIDYRLWIMWVMNERLKCLASNLAMEHTHKGNGQCLGNLSSLSTHYMESFC